MHIGLNTDDIKLKHRSTLHATSTFLQHILTMRNDYITGGHYIITSCKTSPS